MIDRRRFLTASTASLLLPGAAHRVIGVASANQPPAPPSATAARRNVRLFYKSGTLNIEAYFSRPAGTGPFPMIVFNHGSREPDQERSEAEFSYVADVFNAASYATLVPERRGYGKSDGPSWTEAVGNDSGAKFVARLQQETDDVLASLSLLPQLPAVDPARLVIAGWSLGGIVTMFALSRAHPFKVGIDEAGGALSWKGSPMLQKALTDAARAVKVPTLFLDAQNDATTDAVTTCAAVLQATGTPHQLKIYPPFTPTDNPNHIPPGHLIFSQEGAAIWGPDETAFLARYL